MYLPGGHATQPLFDGSNPAIHPQAELFAIGIEFAPHCKQEVEPEGEYRLASQLVQEPLPIDGLNDPPAHTTHPELFGWYPAAHEQFAEPAVEFAVGPHDTQDVAPSNEYEFALQLTHVPLPMADLNLPNGQATHKPPTGSYPPTQPQAELVMGTELFPHRKQLVEFQATLLVPTAQF